LLTLTRISNPELEPAGSLPVICVSAYVSIRRAYVSIRRARRQPPGDLPLLHASLTRLSYTPLLHASLTRLSYTPAYRTSTRPSIPGSVSIRRAYVQHTSSIRQHTSPAYRTSTRPSIPGSNRRRRSGCRPGDTATDPGYRNPGNACIRRRPTRQTSCRSFLRGSLGRRRLLRGSWW
jgi:hypothetical protein